MFLSRCATSSSTSSNEYVWDGFCLNSVLICPSCSSSEEMQAEQISDWSKIGIVSSWMTIGFDSL